MTYLSYNTRYEYFFYDKNVGVWSILEQLCFDKPFKFHLGNDTFTT